MPRLVDTLKTENYGLAQMVLAANAAAVAADIDMNERSTGDDWTKAYAKHYQEIVRGMSGR